METRAIQTGGGAVLFWRIGDEHTRQPIAEALADLGMSSRMPPERKPNAVLRDAIAHLYGSERHDLTPVKRGGWQLTAIDRRNDRNEYRPLFVATITKDTEMIYVNAFADDIDHYGVRRQLEDRYPQFRDLLRGAAITDLLTESIVSEWAGTTLRPSGGVYWLADEYLDRFAKLSAACERASRDSKTTVYRVNHRLDADALRAVHDAIVAEVERDTADLVKGVDELETTGAVERRRDQAQAIRAKVGTYEGILGTALPALRESVEQAALTASRAALALALKARRESANVAA